MDNRERLRRPELYLHELLNKYAKGQLLETSNGPKVLFRATVICVDPIGGMLSNETGSGEVSIKLASGKTETTKATVGPKNPKNSIKARIITKGLDRFIPDRGLRIFWPMFQEHMSIPVVPGEHVYVAFEDENFEHGLWFSRVSGHEGVNSVEGSTQYKKQTEVGAIGAFEESDEEDLSDDYLSETLHRDNLNDVF